MEITTKMLSNASIEAFDNSKKIGVVYESSEGWTFSDADYDYCTIEEAISALVEYVYAPDDEYIFLHDNDELGAMKVDI
jgi:adenine-specific DNA methylase